MSILSILISHREIKKSITRFAVIPTRVGKESKKFFLDGLKVILLDSEAELGSLKMS
jgi:hypothetical protein